MSTRWVVASALLLTMSLLAAPPALAGSRPNTTIKAGPAGLVTTTTVSFSFKSSQKGSRFQCRMDAKAWKKCTSPAKFRGLAQGAHTFSVRAVKNGRADRTPAKRSFQIDSIAPQTTLLSAPEGVIADHNPTFTFSAPEAATFQCRLGSAAFSTCVSPHSIELPDEVYTFAVRARDAAGNVDATPATRTFEVLTPITQDQATAEAAAAFYFPDSADLDVPSDCGSLPVDCPGGVASPPTDQIRVIGVDRVVEGPDLGRFDVTVTVDVSTLAPFILTRLGADCSVAVTSADGTVPTWDVVVRMDFVSIDGSSEFRIHPDNPAIEGIEDGDVEILPTSPFCSSMAIGAADVESVMIGMIDRGLIGGDLCAARGPDYLGRCPSQ
jgi:hypothetical protein